MQYKKYIRILGIKITDIKQPQVMGEIEKILYDGKQHQIVTPNPEIVMKAAKLKEKKSYRLSPATLKVY